jgi:hypothetical protein
MAQSLDPKIPLELERKVANAHRYIWQAALLAESWQHQELADDLHQIGTELRRINESLVKRSTGAFRAVRTRT